MLSNLTIYIIFVSIIIVSIAYNLTPFLSFKFDSGVGGKEFIRLGNSTVLDNLKLSSHKYEISDCFNMPIVCKSHNECTDICSNKIEWRCDTTCKPKLDINPTFCTHGVLIYELDESQSNTISKCVCTNPMYYGPTCSIGTVFCDILKGSKCLCRNNNINFKWKTTQGKTFDICIPKTHYRLFSNQPNFIPIIRGINQRDEEPDWFNYLKHD